ncbi:hypothetical protein CHUAL_013524 [Chamberlinius hualienensis]
MKKSWRTTGIPPEGYRIVPPDGKWGWMVLVGCLICGYAGITILVCFGVIMDNLINEFQTTRTEIAWVVGVFSCVSDLLGPLSTVMVHMLSCRLTVIIGGLCCSAGMILSTFAKSVEVLIATLGVITGFGICLVFFTVDVVLSQYFSKYYGIVMGLLLSSYSVSKVTATPITQMLLDYYGWRGTLLIMGGFLMNICVGGALFQPAKRHTVLIPIPDVDTTANEKKQCLKDEVNVKEETVNSDYKDLKDEEEKQLSLLSLPSNERLKEVQNNRKIRQGFREKLSKSFDLTLFKNRQCYFIIIHYSLLMSTMIYSTIYLYPFGVGAGLQPMEAAGLVSARSIAEIIGRIVGPIIITALKLPTLPAFIICATLSAITFFVLSYLTTMISLYAIGSLSGLIFGAAVSVNSMICLEIIGAKRLPSLIGICTFFSGCLSLGVGPLIGWVCDASGTYASCLILLGFFQLLMSLTWIIKLVTDKCFPIN